MNERTWKISEQSKTVKRNAPQVLLVAANKPASKKLEKGWAIEEYPPISCMSEELSVILDRWIADRVHDRGKGIVVVVIHAGDEEEDPMISATLTPTAIKTLQRSFVFHSLFNQLGLTPEARMATTEAIVGIASSSRSHCFTAKAHASRAFLEMTNAVTFTDEDMEVQYPDHKRPLYVPAMINEVHVRKALVDTSLSLNILPLSTLVTVGIS
nr:hypothetical protein CFP56_64503 [Quercus suber]